MNQADSFRYSQRAAIDGRIHRMRERIIDERRTEIGRQAAFLEAIDVTTGWYRSQYQRIKEDVMARWGVNA